MPLWTTVAALLRVDWVWLLQSLRLGLLRPALLSPAATCVLSPVSNENRRHVFDVVAVELSTSNSQHGLVLSRCPWKSIRVELQRSNTTERQRIEHLFAAA